MELKKFEEDKVHSYFLTFFEKSVLFDEKD
jgi:hypothetical protein